MGSGGESILLAAEGVMVRFGTRARRHPGGSAPGRAGHRAERAACRWCACLRMLVACARPCRSGLLGRAAAEWRRG